MYQTSCRVACAHVLNSAEQSLRALDRVRELSGAHVRTRTHGRTYVRTSEHQRATSAGSCASTKCQGSDVAHSAISAAEDGRRNAFTAQGPAGHLSDGSPRLAGAIACK